MLIESLIRPLRSPERIVTVRGKQYAFRALIPNRFIADVPSEDAQVLLQHPKLYSEFTDKLPEATLQRAQAEKPTPAPKPKAEPSAPAAPPPQTERDASSTASETDAAAQALLASTPAAIAKQLQKKAPPREVLQAALTLEQGAKKPRPAVVASVSGALSAMDS